MPPLPTVTFLIVIGTSQEEVTGVGGCLTDGLAIVPSVKVHILSDELDGRLGAVNLAGRHVQVVDEKNKELPQRWTKYALSSERIKPAFAFLLAKDFLSMKLRCGERKRYIFYHIVLWLGFHL